ncbi:hypothetical protein PHBOTO_004179 [Pseudozyma hubeiensis]|nr:hypothetical protein PHBOTO_004179 [Pseudozyma hubeiensis]
MPIVDEAGSGAELSSVNAPTTIPEEPTPVSPASPPIPLDSEGTDAAQQAHQTTQQQTKQPAGRFIENISTDGSRASAEGDADAEPKQAVAASQGIPETQMRQARSIKPASNVLRRGSKKKTAQSDEIDATASTSQPTQPTDRHDQYVSPSTEGSTQKASPHPNDLSSPSDESGHHGRAFKKVKGGGSDAQGDANQDDDNDHDHDDEEHPILAALYPLTNFIGYRPLSHPHTPSERRRTPKDSKFNRFHYICGCIFSLGLPVSGDTGEIARYRDPYTGKIELVRMYKHQVGAKLINSVHSVIAAWVVIALLSLVSRSPFHRAHNAPLIIGAFATEAVVTFFAFRTPLAQPKNILLGNSISAVMGVAMEKAFAGTNYSVSGVYGIDWIAAATAVSGAVFAMQIFGFTHPPGAAIALLAITDQRTHDLDWWLIPVVIISSLIVIGWALIINNVGGRRYPENWFYMNAFAEPPIVGPEKLPFSNSPYQLPPSSYRRKRKRGGRQGGDVEEKGFYRVPDSGAKVTHGFGGTTKTQGEPQPKAIATAAGDVASHTMGGAGRVRHMESLGSQVQAGSKQSLGAGAGGNGEDGRTTRASEVTKVDSNDAPAVPPAVTQQRQRTTASTSATAPTVAAVAAQPAPTHNATPTTAAVPPSASSTAVAPAAPELKSRMIETDATVVSRNNSKSSKKSKRSIVVHVNENRRPSAGSGSTSKIPPVPAVQWRGPE